jgi:predicted nucleic acid-binding protein
LLEAKAHGLTAKIEPLIQRLSENGMWLSQKIKRRILELDSE